MAKELAHLGPDQAQTSEKPSLREHCGVIAVWAPNANAQYYAAPALVALQHRGLESAGATGYQNGKLKSIKGMGMVVDVLTEKALALLGESNAAIAHTRYATTGSSVDYNAQPITMRSGKYAISIAHNGNLINLQELQGALHKEIKATSDTACQTALLVQERRKYSSWIETLKAELPRSKGAFSSVALTESGEMFGFRDEYGIRPLCIGRFKTGGWVIASETVGLDAIGAEYMRDVAPGEIVHVDAQGKLSSEFFGKASHKRFCALELEYFARPDSYIEGTPGVRLEEGRKESGRRLAKRMQEKGISPTLVVPVLNSGEPASKGVAEQLGVPRENAIKTNPNAKRTFILPNQDARERGVNGKHNVVPDKLRGEDIAIIDDSIVRLTTLLSLSGKVSNADPHSIHVGLATPPVEDACDLGVDMPHRENLAASVYADQARREGRPVLPLIETKVAQRAGVNSVTYLPIEDVAASFGRTPQEVCYHCFGGPHPIKGEQATFRQKERPTSTKPRIAVLISGEGTNMEQIAMEINNGTISGEIVSVISNTPKAGGIARAQRLGLPVTVMSSTGKLTNVEDREAFESAIADHLENINAEIVVFAGWRLVVGKTFTQRMQQREVPIINLHPGLLTPGNDAKIMTSQGEMSVVRGLHAINDAYEQRLAVSGVTVHQVLPGDDFDTGPILLKEEVRRRKGEPFEVWEARIHETEYRVLPTAIKRLIHIMKQRIDVTQGDFPW